MSQHDHTMHAHTGHNRAGHDSTTEHTDPEATAEGMREAVATEPASQAHRTTSRIEGASSAGKTLCSASCPLLRTRGRRKRLPASKRSA